MARFPHLRDNGNESDFPNIGNVEVFKYDNTLDYSRFDNVQMNITLCKVPWDMGEAHVGNRTISGIGNVVYFGSKAKRDEWFDALPDDECYRFATKYKELHRDNTINVPIPFDVASRYNYIAVEYEPFASSGDLLEYETASGLDRWYWFIREVEFLAPNTTRLHLLNDAWQTFIYDMDIPYMMLERGHYGMKQTSANAYLADPIANNGYLLAPEMEQPNPPRIATSTHEHVFNTGTMYAIVITSSIPYGSWGSKSGNDWTVPAGQSYIQGVNSYFAMAIPASNFLTFVTNMTNDVPQFAQTVQAVCFVGSNLVTLGTSFSFCGVTCYYVAGNYQRTTVHSLSKADFNYPARYADIAKLYTYPYASLVITDSNGDETEIRIEDTNGKIELDYCLSLVYPWLQIDGQITSTGKTSRRNISFSNIDAHSMPIGGNWHELLMSWEIPTFGITESAYKVNDYATHYDRNQQAYAGDNAQANANASADNITANADLSTAANTAITTRSNTSATNDSQYMQDLNAANALADNVLIDYSTKSTIAAAEQQAAISAGTTMASGVIGAVASGNPVGAAASIAGGVIGAAGTMASTAIANGLTATNAGLTQAANTGHSNATNITTRSKTENQVDTASDITDYQNTLTTGSAANSSATQKANAVRDRATVTSSISNQIAQASIGAPETFGDIGNGEHATTRPLAVYSNVLTQDDYTLKRFGDDFLRYGYSLNGQIEFDGNWCVMPKFTYWRLTDFWVKGLQVPDMYVDKIRFFLFGGVTVWADPDDIGNVSIYENV